METINKSGWHDWQNFVVERKVEESGFLDKPSKRGNRENVGSCLGKQTDNSIHITSLKKFTF